MGESGSARFVIGSPLKGEFSIYIEYLFDRTDTVGCIWAATGSLIAGLHIQGHEVKELPLEKSTLIETIVLLQKLNS